MGGSASAGRSGGRRAVPVNGYSERWLRQGFPWVYPNECTGSRGNPGEEVRLVSPGGDALGVALADDGWIAARRFRLDDGPIDGALLGARLDEALAVRRVIVPPRTTAWRWVNAENDRLPGIRLDVWGGRPDALAGAHLTLTLDSPSLAGLVAPLVEALVERGPPASVFLAWRPDPRETTAGWSSRAAALGLVYGTAPAEPVEVEEEGTIFLVDPAGTTGTGPSPDPNARRDAGLYADMRANRAWLAPTWPVGGEVLNLFAYTCAFSVVAARAGARAVSVDLSAPYLGRGRANFARNGLDPAAHEWVEEDSFKALDRFRRQGRAFDRVILDPPGFSHGPAGRWSAEQDYPRLAAAALRVTRRGGWLVAACNVGTMSPRNFVGALAEGARKAEVDLLVLHEGGQSPDFPAAASFPEGRYLKFVVAAVR